PRSESAATQKLMFTFELCLSRDDRADTEGGLRSGHTQSASRPARGCPDVQVTNSDLVARPSMRRRSTRSAREAVSIALTQVVAPRPPIRAPVENDLLQPLLRHGVDLSTTSDEEDGSQSYPPRERDERRPAQRTRREGEDQQQQEPCGDQRADHREHPH